MTFGGHLFRLYLTSFFFCEILLHNVYRFLYCTRIQVPLSAGLSNVTSVGPVFILAHPCNEEMCVVQYFNLVDLWNIRKGMKGRKK